MATSWKTYLVYGAAAVAGIAAVLWLLSDDPIPVDLHVVENAPLVVTVDEEGVTSIKETYIVSAPIAGRVQRNPLEVGDPVIKNKTVVATLAPVSPTFLDQRTRETLAAKVEAAQSAVALATAKVARAKADLEFKDKQLGRARQLIRRKTISEHRLDEAIMAQKTSKAGLATALAELDVRKQELESTRAQLIEPGSGNAEKRENCCVKVYAPASGRVIRIVTESETIVASGAPLVELGDPSDLEVVVDLLSRDAVRLREGARAFIVSWGGDITLHGIVKRIEPTAFTKVSALGIEEQRVKVRLAIKEPFEQRSRLGHDYRVIARIVEWETTEALRVPLSALFRVGDNWSVFVVENGTARLRAISIDHKNDRYAEVIEGLMAGERVILHPNDRIESGTAVMNRLAAQS